MSSQPALSNEDLAGSWQELGVRPGDVLMVHGSLSAFGPVHLGAQGIISSLRTAVGRSGTLVMPAFTPRIADPSPQTSGLCAQTQHGRDAVPDFDATGPSQMGAISEALRKSADTVRSTHPQVSVIAQGPAAAEIVAKQTLGYAVGRQSPFAAVRRLNGRILLLGVGHNRNTFLHHAESLCPLHRRKLRRFPMRVQGERVWIEAPDVADDLDTLFPRVGLEFEELGTTTVGQIGRAHCRLLDADSFVDFAVGRLEHYLRLLPVGAPPPSPAR
ncbi:aminoglycoside 3-N-acetyltransferase [Nakamurella panacisegetis]|uniref:Aminoglycoside N(3)-acetyltransferase n=2 Tax=Nakamurella panacisegetis TaxID=1090615 RepID=A0A1H0RXQ2_9ACTN|nr:aminoglycoside 3-N-acetyltransferase [Nakamurella panacisegetis]